MAEWENPILGRPFRIVLQQTNFGLQLLQYTNLRRTIYAFAHFTMRFPGHAFCCALRQVDKDDEE